MRNLLFISTIVFSVSLQAQITINSTDMPAVGDTFHSMKDPQPGNFNIGQAGADRTWDFSSLNGNVPVTTYAVAPASTPYAADFPNANLVLTNDHVGYIFYKNTNSALQIHGTATVDATLGAISLANSPIPDQYHFPATYLTNFSGSSGFVKAKPYNQLPPSIQHLIDSLAPGVTVTQVRVTNTATFKDSIDAWGKVITPIGTYDALRRKRIENSSTVVAVQISGFFWYDAYTIPSNTTEYSWLSTITKIPLVSLTYDTSRNITAVTYSITPPPPAAGFTWDNPAGGTVNFTNTSTNSPETYEWDFGDGNNSNLENPSHDYAANGSYYVCLTVTNASGNDTFCDSVHVTGMISSVTVSGTILYETDARIRSVNVDASGSSPDNMVTDTSGDYSFTFNVGDSATITPSKNNDTTNGITTLDIIFVQKQILVQQPLPLNTPAKLIAADVNGSKTVTTLDIVFIRAVILRVNPTFPSGKVWSFVPSDYSFPDSSAPFVFPSSRSYESLSTDLTNQNFIGIKMGDVNNSWVPAQAKTGAVGELRFTMDDQNVSLGTEVTIPVKVKDFKNIAGYQFTVSWDPQVLAFEDVMNRSLKNYFGTTKSSEGFLTTSWNDDLARDISLNDDEVVFELKFKAIGSGGTSSEVKIGSTLTSSEAYNGNLDLLNIISTNGMVKVDDEPNTQLPAPTTISLQVQPNPFSHYAQITFEVPNDGTVSLSIYDMLGREVKQETGYFTDGKHQLEWQGDDSNGNELKNGLYQIQMKAGVHLISKKTMLLK